MKLLLTSVLMIASAASAATVEKPYVLSSEEITYLANTPCDGRGNRSWCTNGWGDFTCEWNRGQCNEVKSSSDCDDNGWRDCQSDSSCTWKSSNGRGRGRCVRNEVDCDDLDWKGCQGESECKWKSSNGRGRGRCEDNKRSSCGGKSRSECNRQKARDNSCRWSGRDDDCVDNHFLEQGSESYVDYFESNSADYDYN